MNVQIFIHLLSKGFNNTDKSTQLFTFQVEKKKKSGHLHLTSSFISLMALSVMSSLEVAIRPFKIGGIISASAVFIKSCTKAMKRSKEEIWLHNGEFEHYVVLLLVIWVWRYRVLLEYSKTEIYFGVALSSDSRYTGHKAFHVPPFFVHYSGVFV